MKKKQILNTLNDDDDDTYKPGKRCENFIMAANKTLATRLSQNRRETESIFFLFENITNKRKHQKNTRNHVDDNCSGVLYDWFPALRLKLAQNNVRREGGHDCPSSSSYHERLHAIVANVWQPRGRGRSELEGEKICVLHSNMKEPL